MLDLLLFGQKTAPDFFWDARSGVLPPGATFTRGSAGWYFSSAGVLIQAAANVPRFDYDPVTLAPLGYLAEAQSTNSIIQSANFSGYTIALAAVSTDGTLGPDNTTAMQKFTAAAGAGDHYLSTGGGSVALNDVFAFSIFVKQGTARYVTIADAGDAAWHGATFDFQTATFSNQTSATGSAQQIAGGLWRIGASITSGSAHTTLPRVGFGTSPGVAGVVQSYTAAGTETGYATGFQQDTAGVGVTSYIPTAGSAVTRAGDILTLPLTSLPGWNPNVGGVLAAAYRVNTSRSGSLQTVAAISDAPLNNAVVMYENLSGVQFLGRTVAGGVLNDLPGANSAALFARRKTAFGWGPSRHQIAHDGTFDFSNAGQALPIGLVNLRIGIDGGTNGLNGTIESIAYYAGARSDAFVQQVSR